MGWLESTNQIAKPRGTRPSNECLRFVPIGNHIKGYVAVNTMAKFRNVTKNISIITVVTLKGLNLEMLLQNRSIIYTVLLHLNAVSINSFPGSPSPFAGFLGYSG